MIPNSNLIAFVLIALPIILIPGPSVLFLIGRSLSLGKLGGIISSLGNATGGVVLVFAVAFGVGTIIAQSVIAFTVVKYLGAAYLIYLGVQAIRHRNAHTTADDAAPRPQSRWRIFGQGFVVGITNPKATVFFVAVLPQFVSFGAGNVQLQLLLLGLLFMAIAVVTDTSWAIAAGFARDWFARSPQRITTLSATGGVALIALGVGSLFIPHAKQ
ncbi:LysE family translocator [Salinibacterium sp. SWN167]|uniref:LysE family translocator n=1 Tax=Salinibacterium sp. SWN167 TaxID=2792054 RepID=UPI0018CF7E8A|nr:LysE family translocator [Salinibacterium sp. SWN167]MBH0084357.1 LysE family translocator [Salinibacterium sp. SWN167]